MWSLYNSKSYLPKTLVKAYHEGKKLVALDSGNIENDDILILEKGKTLDDLKQEISDWLSQQERYNWPNQSKDWMRVWDEGPNKWTLRLFDKEEIDAMFDEYLEDVAGEGYTTVTKEMLGNSVY